MRAFYSDTFRLPLPPTHTFPMEKYTRVRERVIAEHILAPSDLHVPHAATDAELEHAHDPDYVRRVRDGELTADETRRIGFPWSPQMVERSRRSAGATLEASLAALEDGVAVNLAGGTHHAFRDHGAGYCVFNDTAVAALVHLRSRRVRRVVVIDADVHQGDGTAAILAAEERAFTFSIHGRKNFPRVKQRSDLDIELEDGTGDTEYLEALERGVRKAIDESRPDLAFYLAGADPLVGDRFGRLALTKAGLAQRDRLVLAECHRRGIPISIAMAGGYAKNVDDTVDVHVETVRQAAQRRDSRPGDR